jgi:hypothetical protein
MDHDQADVTFTLIDDAHNICIGRVFTSAEILGRGAIYGFDVPATTPTASAQDVAFGPKIQEAMNQQAAVQLGMVPLSPHLARIEELERGLARVLAENTRLSSINAVLQRDAEAIAPEPAKGGIPARALAYRAQRIGLTTEFHHG